MQYVKDDKKSASNNIKALGTKRFSNELINKLVSYYNDIELRKDEALILNIDYYYRMKICRLHMHLLESNAQYSKIDGQKNVWIVKPSYNARGVGIYCTNNLKEIV
jgi:hypothetical protein